ncbi:MAG: hypothetical protein R3Y44_07490 [Rikenellaceae bacterium]
MRIVKLFFVALLISSIVEVQAQVQENAKSQVWNFDTLDGWVYAHQDDNPNMQCEIEDGVLKIFTTANSRDRKKMRTADKIYTTGRYTWRTYIPQMGKGDQASVGSWIYCDDKHEIDFEVGYGQQHVREKLGAEDDDLIVYSTTQANPYNTQITTIKSGWHIFEIDLTLVDGAYLVTWIIDGEQVSSIQQTYGDEYKFYIFCSVENLKFLGDHIASQDNYGLFDFVKYEYHE